MALKQLQLFMPGANLLYGHIHVNKSHEFPNLRDCYYSDGDVTGMTVFDGSARCPRAFCHFLFYGLCVCRDTVLLGDVVCDDKGVTE